MAQVTVELSWLAGSLRLRPSEQVLALRTPDELMDSQLFWKRNFAGGGFGRTSQGDRLVWAHM